ncbi:MAG: SagB/ThcOx family dehydrogenase [Candidatus Lokiarchaeota archaeon]|nr:SagB/ThcOx family dehydrogenase [Candidatus Lokiarchaeota archaeon]MBD3339103.1 SagB/ThcOx family dehydrogenase [Candidatus Lokiarchaeota archaeon]
MSEKYGDIFQQKSKYRRGELPNHYLDWANKPKTYKTYEKSIFTMELPKPVIKKNIDFWQIVLNRKSTRNFSEDPLSKMDLSVLLFGMTGLTRVHSNFAYRTIPSAGGLYPIEIYPVINNVEEIEKGIYHYNILEHRLECLKEGNFREEVSNACLGQKMAYTSAINFIWTAVINRSKWKYLQRCYRYIYLDCGHIGQNLYLIGEALDLGVCTIGAIFDDELNELLDVDGVNETAVYVGVIGKKKYKKR